MSFYLFDPKGNLRETNVSQFKTFANKQIDFSDILDYLDDYANDDDLKMKPFESINAICIYKEGQTLINNDSFPYVTGIMLHYSIVTGEVSDIGYFSEKAVDFEREKTGCYIDSRNYLRPSIQDEEIFPELDNMIKELIFKYDVLSNDKNTCFLNNLLLREQINYAVKKNVWDSYLKVKAIFGNARYKDNTISFKKDNENLIITIDKDGKAIFMGEDIDISAPKNDVLKELKVIETKWTDIVKEKYENHPELIEYLKTKDINILKNMVKKEINRDKGVQL